jgi:hypothetical protein
MSASHVNHIDEQSNGVLVCAIGIIRWHRQAMMEQADGLMEISKYPTEIDSYNQFIQVAKRLSVGQQQPRKLARSRSWPI